MNDNTYTPERVGSQRRKVAGFTHVGDAVAEFLDDLKATVERRVDDLGGMRGVVTPPQRPWSHVLDAVEGERPGSAP